MISVNASTGAQKLIASGGRIDRPLAIQYTNGDLFVADSGTTSHPQPNLVEINLRTHKQTLVTQNGSLLEPLAIQPGPGNTIYLADSLADTTGAISQVNCQTGQQTLIATGGYLNQPVDMAVDPEGDLIVVDGAGGGRSGLGNVVSINPRTAPRLSSRPAGFSPVPTVSR